MADSLGNMVVNVVASTRDFDRLMDRSTRKLDDFDRRAGLVGKAVKAIGSGVGTGLGFAGATAGLRGLGDVAGQVRESLTLAGDAEKMQAAFETLLGDAGTARRVVADIRRFAAESPFRTPELVQRAKELSAYGIETDQLLPTLKALGDVSAGTGHDLGRLTLAYGQVRTAGKLFGTELRQFSEAGVPLVDTLATVLNKPKEAIRGLVEEGRVGFADVVRSFKLMTEAGGKFAGMTDRFAGTYAGRVEQLADAWDRFRIKFGTVLIDELGLKDAAVQLADFVDRTDVLNDRIRPAVRFLGELGRAGAQVGYELAKAGAVIAQVNLDAFGKEFPQIGQALTAVRDVVRELADFKLDPKQLAGAALLVADAALGIVEQIDLAIRAAGQNFRRDFLDPLKEFLTDLKALRDNLKAVKEAPGNLIDGALLPFRAARDVWDAAHGRLPQPGGMAIPVPRDTVGFGGGQVVGVPAPSVFAEARDRLRAIEKNILAALDARSAAFNAVPPVAALGGLAAAGDGIARADAALASLAGAAAFATRGLRAVGLVVPDTVDPRVTELAGKLKDQFRDPVEAFREFTRDVRAALDKGLIGPDVAARAMRDRVGDLAGGAGGPAPLPGAAEFGSREFARLQAEAIAGTPRQTVEDLLRQIADLARTQTEIGREHLAEARRLGDAMPQPVEPGR